MWSTPKQLLLCIHTILLGEMLRGRDHQSLGVCLRHVETACDVSQPDSQLDIANDVMHSHAHQGSVTEDAVVRF